MRKTLINLQFPFALCDSMAARPPTTSELNVPLIAKIMKQEDCVWHFAKLRVRTFDSFAHLTMIVTKTLKFPIPDEMGASPELATY